MREDGPVTIYLRCDGDARRGAGHVARCLPISRALRAGGHEPVFVGRYEAFAAELLEGVACRKPEPGRPAGLPGGDDPAVVDLYGLPADELEAEAAGRTLLVFADDGAATPGLTVDYHLEAVTAELAGPDFAPLDPRHAGARRSRDGAAARGLVTLGGGETGAWVADLAVAALRERGVRDIAVTGSSGIDGVRRLGRPGGLWDELRAADVVVSGSGLSSYEAACAGLPEVLVVVADNQERVARGLVGAGAATAVDARDALDGAQVGAAIDAAPRDGRGPALVDGYGAHRLAEALLTGGPPPDVLRYRPATLADALVLRGWRNDEEVRSVSGSTAPVTEAGHGAWLARVLAAPDRELLVAERDGEPVGTLRFDREGGTAEISISVAGGRRGGGLGTRMLREATRLQLAAHPSLRRVTARIHAGNARSLAAFERAGYRRETRSDDWWSLASER